MKFKDKRVIVTAGTQGLGLANVEAYLAEGAFVATCARSEDQLMALQEKHGDHLFVKKVDLLEVHQTQSFVKDAVAQFKGLDIFVFNAPHSVKVPIPQLTLEDWKKSFDCIYTSLLAASQIAVPELVKSKNSALIVISSLAAVEPIDVMPASSVLRSGIAAWVKLMAREYGPQGVRFNAVMPGFMETAAVKKGFAKKAEALGITLEEFIKTFTNNVPLRRLGKPSEIASAVQFLSSDEASFITGTTLLVDGGLVRGV